MTDVSQRQRTAESAAAVVTEFFGRYRAHDVDGMTDLCSVNADFSYVPVELWGKQRVLRGDGKVCTVGKPLWTGLIASFPNLSNIVHSVTSNDDGDVVAQVDVEGTQKLAWGLVALEVWPTVFGAVLLVYGQLWRIDRLGIFYDQSRRFRD